MFSWVRNYLFLLILMRLITVLVLWFSALLWGKYFTTQKHANQSLVILMQRNRNFMTLKPKFVVNLCKGIGEIYGHSWFAVVKPYIFKWKMASVSVNWILRHTHINCLGIRKVYVLRPAHILHFDNHCWDSFFLLAILIEGVEKCLLLVINTALWEYILPLIQL